MGQRETTKVIYVFCSTSLFILETTQTVKIYFYGQP